MGAKIDHLLQTLTGDEDATVALSGKVPPQFLKKKDEEKPAEEAAESPEEEAKEKAEGKDDKSDAKSVMFGGKKIGQVSKSGDGHMFKHEDGTSKAGFPNRNDAVKALFAHHTGKSKK